MTFLKTAAVAVSVIGFATVAQAANVGIGTTTMKPQGNVDIRLTIKPIVACLVAGSPSEFPDDVKIWNKGPGKIVKGTKVHWSVPYANKQGNYVLTADLDPNKTVLVSGAIGYGIEAGHDCKASY